MQRLQYVLGSPPSAHGENIDCGATRATWSNGLTTWFSRGKFVGWSAGAAADNLSSTGGLRIGATRSELESGSTMVQIAPSTLGRSSPPATSPGFWNRAPWTPK